MKKELLFLTTLLVLSMVVVSCDNDATTSQNDPQAVQFTSGITATPQVRVAIDNNGKSVWEQGDPIGIYMVAHGKTNVVGSAGNIKYKAASAGASTTFNTTGTKIYYPVRIPEKVDFIAYHPYNRSVSNGVYLVNVATQTPQSAIDLLWAKADGDQHMGYDNTNTSAVDFTFEHQLVKLIMNVRKDVGITGSISAVSINGMNTTADFNLNGDKGFTALATPQGIIPYTATAESKYEAILLPVLALGSAHTVTFTIGDETYTWKMSDNITGGLETGKIYTYHITLKKHRVEVSGSINSRIPESTGSGSAIAEQT